MPTPSRRPEPNGEELGSVTPLGGKVEQGLAPKRSIPIGMERGYKAGLLVAEAKVKGFEKPWSILIDFGASCNYARRLSLEGSQLYAEALTAHEGESITVRLTLEVVSLYLKFL